MNRVIDNYDSVYGRMYEQIRIELLDEWHKQRKQLTDAVRIDFHVITDPCKLHTFYAVCSCHTVVGYVDDHFSMDAAIDRNCAASPVLRSLEDLNIEEAMRYFVAPQADKAMRYLYKHLTKKEISSAHDFKVVLTPIKLEAK